MPESRQGAFWRESGEKTACDVTKQTAVVTSGDGGRKNGFFATLRMTEYLALRMTGPREVFRLDGTFPPPVSPEVLVDGPPKAKRAENDVGGTCACTSDDILLNQSRQESLRKGRVLAVCLPFLMLHRSDLQEDIFLVLLYLFS